MRPILLEATKETPHVHFDAAANTFKIEGRSFPLNAKGFYLPLLEWLDSYAEQPNSKTDFIFRLEYFNTPSSKSISDILKKLKSIKDAGNDVSVQWFYEEDDIDILDLGHVFARTVGMDFEFKEFTD
ncbi:MAG: DUF1987 domain-containing protein [Flavobacteriales bacterium]|nr:DUF1987 domain-containing protein [Flavobacteriales bacterium]